MAKLWYLAAAGVGGPNVVKTSDKLNYAFLRAEQQRHVRRINDIYIEAELSIRGLREVSGSIDDLKMKGLKNFKIRAPSIEGRPRNIRRELGLVKKIVEDRIKTKEYIQSIVFAVALIEGYTSWSLECVIRAYPQKILISAKGAPLKETDSMPVDMRDVVKATSLDTLIADRAKQRVVDAAYATPEDFFKYCEQIFGFGLKETLRSQYIELKAARDVYVHNDGVANQIYLRKSGTSARAKDGEPLPIDSEYLSDSIVCLKQVLSDTYRGLIAKYGKSHELNGILKMQQR
jgi:hypothetical protein